MNNLIIFNAKYLFLLSPLLFAGFFWFENMEEKRKIFWVGLFSIPLTYLLGLFSRALYFNPRPFVEGGFTPLIRHLPDNGFPSDHMLLLSALAVLAYSFNKKASLFLWLIAIIVGISRVLAGVHHLIDIGGSVVIALLSGWLVYFVLSREKKV